MPHTTVANSPPHTFWSVVPSTFTLNLCRLRSDNSPVVAPCLSILLYLYILQVYFQNIPLIQRAVKEHCYLMSKQMWYFLLRLQERNYCFFLEKSAINSEFASVSIPVVLASIPQIAFLAFLPQSFSQYIYFKSLPYPHCIISHLFIPCFSYSRVWKRFLLHFNHAHQRQLSWTCAYFHCIPRLYQPSPTYLAEQSLFQSLLAFF